MKNLLLAALLGAALITPAHAGGYSSGHAWGLSPKPSGLDNQLTLGQILGQNNAIANGTLGNPGNTYNTICNIFGATSTNDVSLTSGSGHTLSGNTLESNAENHATINGECNQNGNNSH